MIRCHRQPVLVAQLSNVGEIENSGVEITLNTVNVSKGDFKWSSDLTFSANKDEVVKLAGGVTEDKGNGRFVGESVRAYYSLISLKVFGKRMRPLKLLYTDKFLDK